MKYFVVFSILYFSYVYSIPVQSITKISDNLNQFNVEESTYNVKSEKVYNTEEVESHQEFNHESNRETKLIHGIRQKRSDLVMKSGICPIGYRKILNFCKPCEPIKCHGHV